MRTRYMELAPRWSPYDIEAAAEAALREQIVEAARLFGFAMPPACVTAAKMTHGDAVELQLGPAREDRYYLEYPMEERAGPTSPVVLRQAKIGQLFGHLTRQRWRDERRRALAACRTPRERLMHQDTGPLGRWALAYAGIAPVGTVSTTHKDGSFDTEIKISGIVDTGIGTLRFEVSNTIASRTHKRPSQPDQRRSFQIAVDHIVPAE